MMKPAVVLSLAFCVSRIVAQSVSPSASPSPDVVRPTCACACDELSCCSETQLESIETNGTCKTSSGWGEIWPFIVGGVGLFGLFGFAALLFLTRRRQAEEEEEDEEEEEEGKKSEGRIEDNKHKDSVAPVNFDEGEQGIMMLSGVVHRPNAERPKQNTSSALEDDDRYRSLQPRTDSALVPAGTALERKSSHRLSHRRSSERSIDVDDHSPSHYDLDDSSAPDRLTGLRNAQMLKDKKSVARRRTESPLSSTHSPLSSTRSYSDRSYQSSDTSPSPVSTRRSSSASFRSHASSSTSHSPASTASSHSSFELTVDTHAPPSERSEHSARTFNLAGDDSSSDNDPGFFSTTVHSPRAIARMAAEAAANDAAAAREAAESDKLKASSPTDASAATSTTPPPALTSSTPPLDTLPTEAPPAEMKPTTPPTQPKPQSRKKPKAPAKAMPDPLFSWQPPKEIMELAAAQREAARKRRQKADSFSHVVKNAATATRIESDFPKPNYAADAGLAFPQREIPALSSLRHVKEYLEYKAPTPKEGNLPGPSVSIPLTVDHEQVAIRMASPRRTTPLQDNASFSVLESIEKKAETLLAGHRKLKTVMPPEDLGDDFIGLPMLRSPKPWDEIITSVPKARRSSGGRSRTTSPRCAEVGTKSSRAKRRSTSKIRKAKAVSSAARAKAKAKAQKGESSTASKTKGAGKSVWK